MRAYDVFRWAKGVESAVGMGRRTTTERTARESRENTSKSERVGSMTDSIGELLTGWHSERVNWMGGGSNASDELHTRERRFLCGMCSSFPVPVANSELV